MHTEDVETTRHDMDNTDPDDIDFSHLARYAWLCAKYPSNISHAQIAEMHMLSCAIIEGINFTAHQIACYMQAAYNAYKKGYFWEDWRAELENQDSHFIIPGFYIPPE